jgi:hypothetical protein
MFSFRDDRWRYRGGVGWTDARLDFYGVGGSLPGGARKIAYELEGLFSTQQALLRLGDSRHFLGLRWVWLDFASLLAEEEGEPDDAELEFESRGSALGPSWEFDSRDNIFTPSRGLVAALDSLFYREEVGSDRDFETYRGYVFAYLPIGKPLVLGLRADARAARGDVPFYQLPFIDLRGVPLGRYQDENAGVLEAELRWTFADRWGLVLFAGDGRAWVRVRRSTRPKTRSPAASASATRSRAGWGSGPDWMSLADRKKRRSTSRSAAAGAEPRLLYWGQGPIPPRLASPQTDPSRRGRRSAGAPTADRGSGSRTERRAEGAEEPLLEERFLEEIGAAERRGLAAERGVDGGRHEEERNAAIRSRQLAREVEPRYAGAEVDFDESAGRFAELQGTEERLGGVVRLDAESEGLQQALEAAEAAVVVFDDGDDDLLGHLGPRTPSKVVEPGFRGAADARPGA